MKQSTYVLLALVIMIVIALIQVPMSEAQVPPPISVAEATICQNVVDREPVQAGSSFPASVGRLYCFTTIIGAQSPIDITHVWYFGGTQRARVNLTVKSLRWRTYSSKKIQSHEIGNWHVDILGPGGDLLHSLQFKITP